MNKDETTVIFESDPSNPPEELKDFKRDIDHSIGDPIPLQEKTSSFPRKYQKLSRGLQKSYKRLKKFREYK